jgi:quercetin dioxygenase-like cupin family protein
MDRPGTDIEYDPERIFVQELVSNYYSLYDEREKLHNDERVVRWADTDWQEKGGQLWNKDVFGSTKGGNPAMGKTQSLQVHIIEMAPKGESQKHVHQNEALMYILEGEGYEIHDDKRYAWEPGDLALIHGGCVHKHYSADPENPARVLIIKNKPMYLFLHLVYQQYIERAPEESIPGWEDYEPDEWGSPNQIDLDPAHEQVFDRLAAHAEERDHDHPHSHHHEFTEARAKGGDVE